MNLNVILLLVLKIFEVISTIYSRCNVHGHDAEKAAQALHCMLQLVSGLRKAWSNASTNEDPHTILTFFNENVTNNADLANVAIILKHNNNKMKKNKQQTISTIYIMLY